MMEADQSVLFHYFRIDVKLVDGLVEDVEAVLERGVRSLRRRVKQT
jgi:hypothetical protein